jgi:ribonuclease E
MPKQIIIAEQHQIAAVFSEDQIEELVVAANKQQVSDIYLGVVENVIPGIDAAFVNIADAERNGFMHVTDLGPLRLKRSAGAITELLTPQQKVLVQVMKEPTGNKGPRLTGNITLPGRYLVLMPYGRGVHLSRRVSSDNERSRLRALAILIKPAGMGLLVRTEAEEQPEEAIMEDLEALQKQWESIQQQANSSRSPALLNRDDDFIQRVLRDTYTTEVNRIVVDSQAGVKQVKEQLTNWNGGRAPSGVLIDHYRDRQPILEYFRVNAAIQAALKPRVELPSGGYIIIEPTEALTVIDVNSGSFTRSATSRETVLWTNCEAASEIARQLRLRKIGGVIIVDFIDMDSRRDQLKVLEYFNQALKEDKARPQISQLSELGLIELTRKRQGQSVYELFGDSCPSCGGLGHLVRLPGESEGESAEVAPSAVPSMRGKSANPQAEEVETWDTTADQSDQDQELLHHPSYSGATNNNTRRRRGRLSEPTPKKESGGKGKSRKANGKEHPSKPEKETSTTTPEPTKKPQTTSSSRREEQKPKTVSVEMTPREQDVYALMGLSPLVRLEQEVKDPNSVILTVKQPEASNSTAENSSAETYPDSTNNTASKPESDDSESHHNESDNNHSARRRRRRSSASFAQASQA